MKNKLLIILVFGFNSLFAQSDKIDTISIVYEKFSSVQNLLHVNKFLFKKNGILYLEKRLERKCDNDSTNLYYFFYNKNHSNHLYYCKFYYKDKLIEEGIWDLYNFEGYYRSYYKNGKLKSEGNFFMGAEIGKWIYYNKKGSVYKIINYPNDINGGSEREKGKINLKKAIKYYEYQTPQDSINFVNSVKGRWLKRYR
jgi:antitoxin component YwqK of YwqJK toxin-antitoxin module